jgi:hypothetical protein
MLRIPIIKRAGRVAQGVGPEFKPQYCKKKKKKLYVAVYSDSYQKSQLLGRIMVQGVSKTTFQHGSTHL